MKTRYLLFLVAALGVLSCGGVSSNAGSDPVDSGVWATGSLARVEVFAGDTKVETLSFTYDGAGRLSTLQRRDEGLGKKLLDLTYNYVDAGNLKISGRFFPLAADKTINVSVDKKAGTLQYAGTWLKPWTYVVRFDGDGVLSGISQESSYRAGNGSYSADSRIAEEITVAGGDVLRRQSGTSVVSQSKATVSSDSRSEATVAYTYSDLEDVGNFNVFLFDDHFPVWMAKGLPGCKHLISGMTLRYGDVAAPQSFRMTYTLDDEGRVMEAVRTDLDGTEELLVRKYRCTYL